MERGLGTKSERDFGVEVPVWGFASHPLVDGELLFTMVGGAARGSWPLTS